jgi:polyisoprenoid-binding protein YceI
MKSIFNSTFLLLISLAFFSCKEKSADGPLDAAATANGIRFVTGPSSSKIVWKGSKPGGEHNGTIGISEGQLFVKDGKITAGNFVIDINTISVADLTGDDKASLEAHLKGTASEGAEDFFNVTKYPTGKFEIISVKDTLLNGGANALVKGNLTLLDKTKEIAIPAQITVTESTISVACYTFKINRTDWGINYKSKNIFKELGDKFINDDIDLIVRLEATKEATEPAKQ